MVLSDQGPHPPKSPGFSTACSWFRRVLLDLSPKPALVAVHTVLTHITIISVTVYHIATPTVHVFAHLAYFFRFWLWLKVEPARMDAIHLQRNPITRDHRIRWPDAQRACSPESCAPRRPAQLGQGQKNPGRRIKRTARTDWIGVISTRADRRRGADNSSTAWPYSGTGCFVWAWSWYRFGSGPGVN